MKCILDWAYSKLSRTDETLYGLSPVEPVASKEEQTEKCNLLLLELENIESRLLVEYKAARDQYKNSDEYKNHPKYKIVKCVNRNTGVITYDAMKVYLSHDGWQLSSRVLERDKARWSYDVERWFSSVANPMRLEILRRAVDSQSTLKKSFSMRWAPLKRDFETVKAARAYLKLQVLPNFPEDVEVFDAKMNPM